MNPPGTLTLTLAVHRWKARVSCRTLDSPALYQRATTSPIPCHRTTESPGLYRTRSRTTRSRRSHLSWRFVARPWIRLVDAGVYRPQRSSVPPSCCVRWGPALAPWLWSGQNSLLILFVQHMKTNLEVVTLGKTGDQLSMTEQARLYLEPWWAGPWWAGPWWAGPASLHSGSDFSHDDQSSVSTDTSENKVTWFYFKVKSLKCVRDQYYMN